MPVLLLNRSDVEALLTMPGTIAAVEQAFAAHARGESLMPALMHVDADGGEFHIKAGGMKLEGKTYFALKANGGFFNNLKLGLPAIQGVVLLCDGSNGSPLALMDSRTITAMRTGAATAVAAKYLARPESSIVTICGCGVQGRIQLRALFQVLPLRKAYAWDQFQSQTEAFASEMSRELGLVVEPCDLAAARETDVIVTCTPAKGRFLERGHVGPGTFISAVGADSPTKQELDPALVAASAVVTDLTAQSAECGELHHALDAGLMTRADVRGELGEVIIGRKPGRLNADEITLFDTTGTALQDAAAAVLVYRAALAAGRGQTVNLS